MTAIQISDVGFYSIIIDVSATPSGVTWTLSTQDNVTQSGNLPQFVKLDNIGTTPVFVNISSSSSTTLVIPTSLAVGNTFPVAGESSVIVQLFDQSGPANSIFNDGSGYCYISAATSTGTSTLILTPVQVI